MLLVQNRLWAGWAPKSLEVFRRLPPVYINGDANAYYRAVATLQVPFLHLILRDARSDVLARHVAVTCWDEGKAVLKLPLLFSGLPVACHAG